MTPKLRLRIIYESNYTLSMGMSFFVSCPISNAQADPDKSGHQPPCCIIVKSALRVCPDLRGTLRPPVKGHAAKKDIPMLFSAVSFLENLYFFNSNSTDLKLWYLGNWIKGRIG